MKLVINKCYGGFGLSNEAMRMLLKRKGIEFFERESSFASNDFFRVLPEEYDKLEERAIADRSDKEAVEAARTAFISQYDWKREDPDLVAVVEKLGEKANDRYAKLAIIEIPDDIDYYIDDYDGIETVHERHRSW